MLMILNKLFYFFMLAAYMLAVVGGVYVSLEADRWPIGAAVVITAWMAWPKVKEYYKKLMEI